MAFDFHPVVLAAPVIAVCIDNIFRQRFRRAALYAASLALIKEELILIIIPIGLVIAIFYHRRKTGFLLAAGGAVALFIVTLVIIPAVNYHGRYDYWSSAGIVGGDGFASGMWHTVTHSFTNAVTPMGKLWNTVLLALPTVFVCLYSPITLAVVPVVLWHLASPNPVYSGTSGHYAVALMPIVFLGAVDAIRRLHERGRAPTVVRLIPAMVGLIALVFFVSANPFRAMLHPGWWHRPRYAIAGAAALERVPDHVTVAVDNNLAPHLTGRDDVHLFAVGMRDSTGQIADVEWVVTNVAVGAFPNQPADRLKLVGKLQRCGYRKVARNLGFVVLHRTVDLGRTGLVTCLAADVPTGQ